MSTPIWSLSPGPACELGKLIVQVVGKDHPEEQKLVLCTDNNEVEGQQDLYEKAFCSSVLHVWDCHGPGKRQLWLEIASTDGAPIRLPLLADVRATTRQADAQWNQIVPVLPFVSLPGSKNAQDHGTPVLARPGFVYVFYENRLWRELEVRLTDGKTTYRDVDVAQYRLETGFDAVVRLPTGKPLDDIWLPAVWNDQPVSGLQVCFSEVQLSAERLQRLEEDPALREQRCKNLYQPGCSNQRFKDLYAGKPDGLAMLEAFSRFDIHDAANNAAHTRAKVVKLNLESGFFPVSVAAPQRARAPGLEWLLDHPARYLCDLSGEFHAAAGEAAKAFLQACEQGTSENNALVRHTQLLELGAVADALEENSLEAWQAQPGAVDVLARARQRQLCGVLLEDPRYRLRHLKMRLDTCHELLKLCAGHATRRAHHGSALLVQQLVVPGHLHGKPNPLHESLKRLGEEGRRAINRSTAVLKRTMVWRHMGNAQDLLVGALQQPITQQTLADHLSLEGFEYLAALLTLVQTLATLAAPPSRLDPLAPSGSLVDAVSGASFYTPAITPGQQWLSDLAHNAEAPLHRMLWPACDLEQVCKPYEPPVQAAENKGDGHYRPCELATLENTASPSPVAAATLDATIVANLLAGPSLNSFLITTGKNVNSALMNIYETLQGAVDTAVGATEAAERALAQASNKGNASDATYPRPKDRLEIARERLGTGPRPVSVELHAQGIEQLRSLLPATWGGVYFLPRNQVTEAHYLFGREDLPSRAAMPKTQYGEFVNHRGEQFGDARHNYWPQAPVTPGKHLVLVMPHAHPTAQWVSRMNRHLVTQQAAAEVEAGNQAAAPNTPLGHAIEQHGKRMSAAVYKVLDSLPFSTAVLMVEVWNVRTEIENAGQTTREKGQFRSYAGRYGASIDLIIAVEALTVKLAGKDSVLGGARHTLFKIPEANATQWLGETVGKRLNLSVTVRLLVTTPAALVFAGLNLYDAWYAWQWNDQAMYGYLLMAPGAVAGGAAGWITATPILGLTPLGWASLLLIGIGATLVLWLGSTPLDDWLEKGPFGSDGGSASHLKDPEEAFYRLISLLSGIRIAVLKNPLFEPEAKSDPGGQVPLYVRSSNTLIRIESRLPGLLGGLGQMGIQADCRLREVVMDTFQGTPVPVRNTVADSPSTPNAQRLYNDALELYVQTPQGGQLTLSTYRYYEWAVRAQFILKTPSATRYFPAPGVKDPTEFGPEYSRPDFGETNRPFWADEQKYKAQ